MSNTASHTARRPRFLPLLALTLGLPVLTGKAVVRAQAAGTEMAPLSPARQESGKKGYREEIVLRKIWRRVHRPEEYAEDIAVYLAKELKLKDKRALVRFAPAIRMLVRGWKDAAVETTEYVEYADGGRTLRTIFDIADYSSSAVYNLLEGLMKAMGVGKAPPNLNKEIDFMWVALGGVLEDYARKAGVSGKSMSDLLEFRLINSDFLTATTWKDGTVEIVNLKTGAVDTLDLPDEDVDRIVGWSLDFFKTIEGKKTFLMKESSPEFAAFEERMERYRSILNEKDRAARP